MIAVGKSVPYLCWLALVCTHRRVVISAVRELEANLKTNNLGEHIEPENPGRRHTILTVSSASHMSIASHSFALSSPSWERSSEPNLA